MLLLKDIEEPSDAVLKLHDIIKQRIDRIGGFFELNHKKTRSFAPMPFENYLEYLLKYQNLKVRTKKLDEIYLIVGMLHDGLSVDQLITLFTKKKIRKLSGVRDRFILRDRFDLNHIIEFNNNIFSYIRDYNKDLIYADNQIYKFQFAQLAMIGKIPPAITRLIFHYYLSDTIWRTPRYNKLNSRIYEHIFNFYY